jgi:hypothetical protein
MGADLIGYMVKAPVELPKDRIDEAVAQANSVISFAHEFVKKQEDNEEGYTLLEELGYTDEDVAKALGNSELDDCELENELEVLAGRYDIGDGEKVVKEFLDNWPYIGRDVSFRRDPDDDSQCYMFAGDMSWGDEPEGFGYETLRSVFQLGFAEYFNIR